MQMLPSRASAPSPPSSAVGELPPPSPIPPDPPDPSSPLSPQQFPPLSSSFHPSKTRSSTVPKPLKHEIKVPASTSPAMPLLPAGLEESDVHLENQTPSPSTVPENESHKKTALSSVSVPATEEETQTPITFTTIAPKQTSPVITNKASSSTLFPPTQNPSYETLTPPPPPILPSPPLNHQKPLEKTLVERLRILEDKSLKRLAPTTVSETGRPRVLIPDSVFEKGAEIHRDFIICYFNGKPPPFNQIQSVFNHMWGKGKQLEIYNNPRNRSTLVRIRSEYRRQKILDKCIWYVGDSMFHTAQWSSEHSMSTPPLKAIKIWAHLIGVPLDLSHQQGLSLVVGLVGEPKETDDFTRNLVSLTLSHVKVEVDLTEPLPSVVEFERQSGEVVEVLVHYPWTPPTCSHCHELGHIVRNCLQLPSDYAPPNPPPVTKKPSSKTKTSNPSHNTPAPTVPNPKSPSARTPGHQKQPSDAFLSPSKPFPSKNLQQIYVKKKMLQWGLQVDSTCLLFNAQSESRNHLYFDCCYSFDLWALIAQRCRITPRRNWDETISQMKALPSRKVDRLLTLLSWQAALYWIWNERNSCMHTNVFRSVDAIFTIIDRQIRNKTQSFRVSNPNLSSAMFQRWIETPASSSSS
ncbi:hypothetical protein DY000_02025567 [Brassica cretica]|uniref:DUF4283 domain-containing protein n=1 Tax=Brassica cretica TaxID=69181 RepID=A0ABQ7E001_BRACR|nr:hypothetical protein DY000_02025567 [Brassica cretica]